MKPLVRAETYAGGCGGCGKGWDATRAEVWEVVSVPVDPKAPIYRYMAAACPACGHEVFFNRNGTGVAA